ncbi:MAG: hypothetical protein ACLR10_10420 [Oscillospiraceae bacterium]
MIHTIDGIIEAARGGTPGVIAVAAAHDQPVIQAVVEARREGIAVPILVGHAGEITAMLSQLGRTLPPIRSSPVTATPTAPPRLWPCVPRGRPTS